MTARAAPALVGQLHYPRGRWLAVCSKHRTGHFLPRNSWTASWIALERRQ